MLVVGRQVTTTVHTDLPLDALEMGLWARARARQNVVRVNSSERPLTRGLRRTGAIQWLASRTLRRHRAPSDGLPHPIMRIDTQDKITGKVEPVGVANVSAPDGTTTATVADTVIIVRRD